MSTQPLESRTVAERLSALGFLPSDQGYHHRGPWHARLHRGWWSLARPWPEGHDPMEASQRGLWKWVPGPGNGWHLFEWPEYVGRDSTEERADGALEQIFGWALTTAEGHLPAGWVAPERAEVEGWCAREAFTIEAGHLLRQVELSCGPEQLLLETPVASAAQVDGMRRAALRRLALEVQGQWPMARMRWEESTSVLTAELDLSGVPPVLGPELISAGLASLRGAVISLAGGAELLADATVVSEALAQFTKGKERTTT